MTREIIDKFDLERGFEVQREQLSRYEKVLKPEIFLRLKQFCDKKNDELKESYNPSHTGNGYLVFRGSDIDMFVQNNLMLNNRHFKED